ncbi:hypothetical protein ABIB57_001043 [Devosia sp. UYZn731]
MVLDRAEKQSEWPHFRVRGHLRKGGTAIS